MKLRGRLGILPEKNAARKREQKKRDAEHAPLFRALNLTPDEAATYYKVCELVSAKIVTLLGSHGYLAPDKVEPALSFVLGVKH